MDYKTILIYIVIFLILITLSHFPRVLEGPMNKYIENFIEPMISGPSPSPSPSPRPWEGQRESDAEEVLAIEEKIRRKTSPQPDKDEHEAATNNEKQIIINIIRKLTTKKNGSYIANQQSMVSDFIEPGYYEDDSITLKSIWIDQYSKIRQYVTGIVKDYDDIILEVCQTSLNDTGNAEDEVMNKYVRARVKQDHRKMNCFKIINIINPGIINITTDEKYKFMNLLFGFSEYQSTNILYLDELDDILNSILRYYLFIRKIFSTSDWDDTEYDGNITFEEEVDVNTNQLSFAWKDALKDALQKIMKHCDDGDSDCEQSLDWEDTVTILWDHLNMLNLLKFFLMVEIKNIDNPNIDYSDNSPLGYYFNKNLPISNNVSDKDKYEIHYENIINRIELINDIYEENMCNNVCSDSIASLNSRIHQLEGENIKYRSLLEEAKGGYQNGNEVKKGRPIWRRGDFM